MKQHIVIIEDDADIQNLLRMNLESNDFRVTVFDHLQQARDFLADNSADLIILDLMLPDGDGLDLCRALREQHCYTPIIILSAKGDEIERILGLEFGADDYMAKPFSIRELLARVRAALRRKHFLQQDQQQNIHCGSLQMNTASREVSIDQQPLQLTSTEFDLLACMASKPGHVFSREKLLKDVWNYQHRGYEHTVNSHINRLRSKLEKYNAADAIQTVWGAGYKFAL